MPHTGSHSGDLGTMDEDGNGLITTYGQDMVIAARNIYPRGDRGIPVSACHEVADVRRCGVPDSRYGEGMYLDPVEVRRRWKRKTFVHSAGTASPVQNPRHVRFVDSFPMTDVEKLNT